MVHKGLVIMNSPGKIPNSVDNIVVEIELDQEPSVDELFGLNPLKNADFLDQAFEKGLLDPVVGGAENEYKLNRNVSLKEGSPTVIPKGFGQFTAVYEFEHYKAH